MLFKARPSLLLFLQTVERSLQLTWYQGCIIIIINENLLFSRQPIKWKNLPVPSRVTEGKNQTLVGAIPFCGEYPGPRFEDKFRSANQIDGTSIADGGKMADSKFVNKKTREIRCYIYKQKCIQ